MKRNQLEKKQQTYLKILNHLEIKVKVNSEVVIICSDKESFVVDKKYENICRYVVARYNKLLEKSSNYSNLTTKGICFLGMLGLLKILTGIYPQEEISYEKDFNTKSKLVELYSSTYLLDKKAELIESKEYMEKIILEKEQEIERIATYEAYLTEYSNYFHLDSEKVIQLAKLTTENYKNFSAIIDCKDCDLEDVKTACILFVYYLNKDALIKDLDDFGLSKDNLLTTTEIETIPHDDMNEFYLSNGKKYSAFFAEICDVFNIRNKSLALAVSLIEISEEGSYSSNNRNNFGGMKNLSGELMEFARPEAGIICMCANFKDKYNDYSEDFIQELACYYVSGKQSMPDPEEDKVLYDEIMRWTDGVKSFYVKINENYTFYFPNNYSEDIFLVRKRQLSEGSIREKLKS